METEIWKDVIWYESYYKVSNLWNVISIDRVVQNNNSTSLSKWRNIKYIDNGHWYKLYWLSYKWNRKFYQWHRLVAQAFIPNSENKPQVNHINGIRNDNRVENLEWVTAKENQIHSWKELWRTPSRWNLWNTWKLNKLSKKVLQFNKNLELIKEWDGAIDAERILWISHISCCCRWKWKTAGWFVWKYL